MKQLTQNLKDGKMDLLEVPVPAVGKGQLLVKTHYSAISAGTEGRSIKDARLGYVGKAKARPKEFKQVLNTAKKMGLLQTYSMVMNKLNAPSPLGYSCAGEVIAVGESITNFKVGDRVACGGQGAVHSEVVSVYENLCVPVPEKVHLKHAAFTTIASIAIQGIRQADIRLGEYCVVIGLGLLGQMTLQILSASGVQAIGVDIDKTKVKFALKNGAKKAILRETDGIEEQIVHACNGHGADAVIITAATNSNDPVNLAGMVSRPKAKIVSVGRVSTDFNRDYYYAKELDLRMSCSYGPGRYDTNYEERGNDYPIGYVRWTENRNMQAFIELLQQCKIDLDILITHQYLFSDAEKAYNLIDSNKEPYLGILLKYEDEKTELKSILNVSIKSIKKAGKPNVGFIGAGSFAKKFLLPTAKSMSNLVTVATNTGTSSVNTAKKFGFSKATCDVEEIINDENINTVFIATRDDTHAQFIIKALKSGKNVFVEKPLCTNEEQLEEIAKVYHQNNLHLMVGFNRRFAPQIQQIMKYVGLNSIKTINYRVNLGPLAPTHWTQDKEISGGRIINEVCHFLDLSMYMCNSKPEMLSAFAIEDPLNLDNTLSVIIRFKNGSVSNVNYYANGNPDLSKEYLEVHSNGISCVLDDFSQLKIYGKKKISSKSNMDKGVPSEVSEFLRSVEKGEPTPITFDDIYWSMKMTFDVVNSIKQRKSIIY